MHPLQLADFDFTLPDALIAQYPPTQRGDSRMLYMDSTGTLQDRLFQELPQLLHAGDLLVLNDTRVLRARLYGLKPTGGKIEILIERLEDPHTALAQIRPGKSCRPGGNLLVGDGVNLMVLDKVENFFRLQSPVPWLELMQAYGHIPLPPYISRSAETVDENRYQTVYAHKDGAVAAPTAGLHFDKALLAQLAELGVTIAYVTLHVGAGTFQPVRCECLDEHVMHSEWCEVSAQVCSQVQATKASGGRVIAIGTTSVRSLESAAARGILQPHTGDTRLFIRPGYQFQVVDAMITNFHLPRSTLLMLVCAFGGMEQVLAAYRHAVATGYRFFSYGDAMFIERSRRVFPELPSLAACEYDNV